MQEEQKQAYELLRSLSKAADDGGWRSEFKAGAAMLYTDAAKAIVGFQRESSQFKVIVIPTSGGDRDFLVEDIRFVPDDETSRWESTRLDETVEVAAGKTRPREPALLPLVRGVLAALATT